VVSAGLVERLVPAVHPASTSRTRHDGFRSASAIVSSIAAVHGGTVTPPRTHRGLDITVRLPRRDNAITPASTAP